ncbi:hypothetical protein CFP56_009155 [Quercus suber]|uniref:Uncharacterized protein n=1 Tax=Quercus suber TaxID=58331 RepID=A0AAW0L1I2_QUESU
MLHRTEYKIANPWEITADSQTCQSSINPVHIQQLFARKDGSKLRKNEKEREPGRGVPLRASDKALTSCGLYKMKEDDAMVYRRPYLTSSSSGFAFNAISRAMKKELKIKIVKKTR